MAGKFRDGRRVASYLDSAPDAAVALIEAHAEQSAIDAIERAMFPALAQEELRGEVQRAKEILLRAGYADDADVIKSLNAELDPQDIGGANPKK